MSVVPLVCFNEVEFYHADRVKSQFNGEQPIPGVTSKLIYDNLKPGVEKSMIHKEDVLDLVKNRDFDVLVILGAGDLDNYVPQITKILEEK